MILGLCNISVQKLSTNAVNFLIHHNYVFTYTYLRIFQISKKLTKHSFSTFYHIFFLNILGKQILYKVPYRSVKKTLILRIDGSKSERHKNTSWARFGGAIVLIKRSRWILASRTNADSNKMAPYKKLFPLNREI